MPWREIKTGGKSVVWEEKQNFHGFRDFHALKSSLGIYIAKVNC